MLYIFTLILSLTFSEITMGSNLWGGSTGITTGALLVAESFDKLPPELSYIFKGKKVTFYTIDLDQDGKVDFIAEEPTKNCFIDSKLQKRNCESRVGAEDIYDYRWFVSLDPKLPLFLIQAHSDGEDLGIFELFKFDKDSLKLSEVCKFRSVIKQNSGKVYNGFPWLVNGLQTKTEKGKILLNYSTQDMSSDPYFKDYPESGKMPFLFFEGSRRKETKPLEYLNLNDGSFKSAENFLKECQKQIR